MGSSGWRYPTSLSFTQRRAEYPCRRYCCAIHWYPHYIWVRQTSNTKFNIFSQIASTIRYAKVLKGALAQLPPAIKALKGKNELDITALSAAHSVEHALTRLCISSASIAKKTGSNDSIEKVNDSSFLSKCPHDYLFKITRREQRESLFMKPLRVLLLPRQSARLTRWQMPLSKLSTKWVLMIPICLWVFFFLTVISW